MVKSLSILIVIKGMECFDLCFKGTSAGCRIENELKRREIKSDYSQKYCNSSSGQNHGILSRYLKS